MSNVDFGLVEDAYTFFMSHSTEAAGDAACHVGELSGFAESRNSIHMLDMVCGQGDFTQHKVPRVLADLVKGQFHLMQEWLRPTLSESVGNSRELERLKTELENYRQVEQSFTATRTNHDESS